MHFNCMRIRVAALCLCRIVGRLRSDIVEATTPRSVEPSRYLLFRGGGGGGKQMSSSSSSTDYGFTVGGGAINEKKRNLAKTIVIEKESVSSSGFDPASSRSHLMHALEGLDRYPNYLSRWSIDDVNRLEHGLERQLTKVREQKQAVLARRNGIDNMVKQLVGEHDEWRSLLKPPQTWKTVCDQVLDPRAAKTIFQSKQFVGSNVPTVQQVLSGQATVELDAHLLQDLMEEELFDVYSLPLLSPEFCNKLKRFVQELSDLSKTKDFSHLHLGRTDLDIVGLSWINDLLFHLVVRPISRHLFREMELEGDDLDFRHGYVASYSALPSAASPRERLVAHTDDSEVTLNVCIGDEFQGGALHFRGLRGTHQAGQLLGTFEPVLGTAIFHAGRHLHEVTQVTAGNRFVYIMWARSWGSTRASVCPCCWLNRRQDKSCICGPRWN